MLDSILDKLREGKLLDDGGIRRVRQFMGEGKALDEAILGADGLTEDQTLRFLADAFEVPFLDLENNGPSKEFIARFPARLLVQHKLLPLSESDGQVLVATSRLFDYDQLHSMNAAASWRRGKWQLGARFSLYSGLPSTPVMGAEFDSDRNLHIPIPGAINSDRAPTHHQLDVRIDYS